MANILSQHEKLSDLSHSNDNSRVIAHQRTRQHIHFSIQLLRGLLARSQAIEGRLRNEINLVGKSYIQQEALRFDRSQAFNTIAQQDSMMVVQISKAARSDSATMKTIALLTLTFLPATFVSVSKSSFKISLGHSLFIGSQTIFSMSFFDFSPGGKPQEEAWLVSEKLWIYWAISLPLTIATVASWFTWQRQCNID